MADPTYVTIERGDGTHFALQRTDSNWQLLVGFVGPEIDMRRGLAHVPGCPTGARVGDWIVECPDKSFTVIDDAQMAGMRATAPVEQDEPADDLVAVVRTRTDVESVARAIADQAVDQRIAAYAHVTGPSSSVYRWDGAVVSAPEWEVEFVCPVDRTGQIVALVLEGHNYELPSLLIETRQATAAYAAWAAGATTTEIAAAVTAPSRATAPVEQDEPADDLGMTFNDRPATFEDIEALDDDDLADLASILDALRSGVLTGAGPLAINLDGYVVHVHDAAEAFRIADEELTVRYIDAPLEQIMSPDERAAIDHDALRAAWSAEPWSSDTSYATLHRLARQWLVDAEAGVRASEDSSGLSRTAEGARLVAASTVLNNLLRHGWLAVNDRQAVS
jgi:periplasmic divalent cation tolerance protein